MKKKTLFLLLALTAMLASCSSSSGKKSCDGDTCKIGYRVNIETQQKDNLIR